MHIVWASSTGISQDKTTNFRDTLGSPPKLDYWIMDADGSNKKQLTHFNDPNDPQYSKNIISVGDFDWSPDGRSMVARVRRNESSRETLIFITF